MTSNLEKLQELSEFLTETESTLSVFWMLNPALLCVCKYGIFVTVNPASLKIIGYTSDELIGRKYIDFVHPDDIDSTKKIEGNLLEGDKITQFVNRYKHKNGQWVYLNWSARFDPHSGQVYAVAADVTLEQTKNFRLTSALDYAPFGVFLTDTNGQCIYVNKKWKELTGLTDTDATGDGWVNGIAEEDRERLLGLWKNFANSHPENNLIHFSCDAQYFNKKTLAKTPVRIISYIYGDKEFIGYVDFCFTDEDELIKLSHNV